VTLDCSFCGAPLTQSARFCTNCGQQVGAAVEFPQTSCGICGNQMSVEARFCAACGNEVGGEEIATDAAMILHALPQSLAPFGVVVLLEGGRGRRPRVLQLTADQEGLLTEQDQQRFVGLLSEILVWDGYLHAVLTIAGKPRSCVWHVINGDLFPLPAEHAMAVLLYYEALAVTDPQGQTMWEAADAEHIVR
jgi:hypothetical protein